MKFDSLANSLLNEMDVERLAKQDPSIEKFNKRSRSKTGQWKSNPAARAIVINLEYGNEEFSESIPSYEIEEAIEGLEPIKAKDGLVIYRAETYVVVVMGNR